MQKQKILILYPGEDEEKEELQDIVDFLKNPPNLRPVHIYISFRVLPKTRCHNFQSTTKSSSLVCRARQRTPVCSHRD